MEVYLGIGENNGDFNIVELALSGLRKRLDENNIMLVQGQGYCEPAQFTFAGGAESEDINEFSVV